MARRSDYISMGLSLVIAAVLLSNITLPSAVTAPNKLKVVTAAPPSPPTMTALSAVTLPPPPPPPAQPKTLTVTPLKPTARAASAPVAAPTPAVVPLKPSRKENSPKAVSITPIRPSKKDAQSAALDAIEPLKPQTDMPLAKPELPKRDLLKPSPTATPIPKPEATKAPDPKSEPADTTTKAADVPKSDEIGSADAQHAMAAGRPLLRLLEHGDGPRIDIAWPRNASRREALFHAFQHCYGMVVALMSRDGNLFSDSAPRAPWQINTDRYSGFVRQSNGTGTVAETAWLGRIRHQHPTAVDAVGIRVFPRGMDALLMGGLRQILGPRYKTVKSIEAQYVMRGRAVIIESIAADGLSVSGRINLSAAASSNCRLSS